MTLFLALLFLWAAVALVGGAWLSAGRVSGVERSLQALQATSLSPEALSQEVQVPFSERVVRPLQGRALAVGRRITGADQSDRIRRKLDLAGNPRDWSVDRVIALKVIAGIAVPTILCLYGLVIGLPFVWILVIGLAGLAVGFFGPDLYLHNVAAHRCEQVRRSLADTVDLLTISVEAGLGFDAALQQVARNTQGPVSEEFARVLREMQLGVGRADAMRALAARTTVEELRAFVGAMVQADSFGVPIGQVLRVQSGEMRLKRRQHAEKRAQQVPVKIMVPLVICILPCLLAIVMGPAIISAMAEFRKV